MSLAAFIPTSMAAVGSICLGLAIVLILLNLSKGPWMKVAGILAFIGGFGLLGGASGWIGTKLMSASQNAMSWTQEWTARAIGTGAVLVILVGIGLWAWSHMSSKGAEAGGKGGMSKRLRALFKGGLLALVGVAIAAAIPELYGFADWAVAQLGGAAQSFAAGL